jgi:hypothetical protein
MNAPYKGEVKTPLQALSKFGLAVTGLSKKAKEALGEVCVWDYMGSAEYEWGAIPKALIEMSKLDLVAFWPTIEFAFHDFWDKKDVDGKRTIYIIAPKSDADEAEKYIRELARGTEDCKERTEFAASLAEHKYGKDTMGWFDLVNHYMFFKDVQMFKDWSTLLVASDKGSDEHQAEG